MDMKNLFNGIAVVIDDEINDPKANIGNIVKQIESAGIPILKYTKLPSERVIRHFHNLSFLLLDWRLIKEGVTNDEIAEGVTIPDTLQKDDAAENIEFIKKLNEKCFCPIFIFTNEDTSVIKNKLLTENIVKDNRSSNIFIQRKVDIKGRTKVFQVIKKWIEKNPSIYVLKEWENEYQSSKNKLFLELQNISPIWPKIVWKNYLKDGVNPSTELGELISRNLYTRMTPFGFSEYILKKQGAKIPAEEVQAMLEGERYITKLSPEHIGSGDIFKISSNYYINIRANCDLIAGRSTTNKDDIELYLLKGSKISLKKGKKVFNKKYGLFQEIDTQAIIFPIDKGKIIDFRFKKLEIKQWRELKDKRIGRLLPPYINRIQQRYALYMQRQGLPRIPDAAIFDNSSSGDS